MRQPKARRWVTALAGVTAVGALAGCGVPVDDRPHAITPGEFAVGGSPASSTSSTSVVIVEALRLWYVQDDLLVSVRRAVANEVNASIALSELLRGPTESERATDIRSAIVDTTAVIDASVVGGVAIVRLARAFRELPARDQLLAIGQLVLTMTDVRGVGLARFVIDGERVAVPQPDGVATAQDVTRDLYLVLTQRPDSSTRTTETRGAISTGS